MFEKILVCVDGSECADRAAKTALDIAWKFGAEVILINVCNLAPAVAPYVMVPEASPNLIDIESYLRATQDTVLADARLEFDKEGVNVKTLGQSGQPVDVIVQTAEEQQADLIVLGSR